jgi:hypothetical protein
VAVLALSASALPDDQKRARELEWCLPGELTKDRVAVVAPEKLMTAEVQAPAVFDKASARAFGLAHGARWVLYGNVADGRANLFVAEVLNERTVHADSFAIDDVKLRCQSFAAAAAQRLRAED